MEILKEHSHIKQWLEAKYLSLEKNRVLLADKGWNIADGLAVELTDILEERAEEITQCV